MILFTSPPYLAVAAISLLVMLLQLWGVARARSRMRRSVLGGLCTSSGAAIAVIPARTVLLYVALTGGFSLLPFLFHLHP